MVLVTGVNTASKHQRARSRQRAIRDHRQGHAVDCSDVMYLHKGKTVRLGYSENKKGEKVRIARPSGEEI